HTRLDLAVRLPDWTMTEGWFATQLFGFLSGVITAGRLRGFDPEQIENSLGIAFTQVSGSRQMAVGASTDLRSMQAGFSGQGAVLAAELAARHCRLQGGDRGSLRDLQDLRAHRA